MKNIPEGATHWSPEDSDRHEAYWKPNGDGYDCYCPSWIDARWQEISDELPDYATPISPEWTGEGLPPVGTVCEIRAHKLNDWSPATIKFAARNVIVWDWEAEPALNGLCTAYAHAIEIRPIRTPEQIAADEREAKAKSMWQQIYFNTDPNYWDHAPEGTRDTFRAAIDAGWQKKSDQ